MKNYLVGYLDILPSSQRSKIEDLIKSSEVAKATTVNVDEYSALIKKIVAEHNQLSVDIPQIDRVDPDLYNKFFNNLQVDMNLMFLESELIDQAINNYERLYDGILGELNGEIKALRERINSLHLVAQGEDGLIVKTVDFTNTTSMETDRTSFSHMFKDRDGSDIADIIIQKNVDHSYIALGTVTNIDYLHDANGAITATIAVVDQRGVPVKQTTYPPSNAIDNSTSSYWGEVVLVDDQINVDLDDVLGGGALVKLQVTLAQPAVISQIVFTPFTTYPMEIASLKYEEDVQTYHIPKELIPQGKKYEDTSTMTIQFPSVIAKRLTFILRQRNFVKDTYLVTKNDLTKIDLWNKISKREEETTLGLPTITTATAPTTATVTQAELDQYSGWDIYLQQLAKYQSQLASWRQSVAAYSAWKVQNDTYQSARNTYISQYGNY